MRKLMLAGILLMALSLILVLTGCSTTTPAATPTPTPIASPTSTPTATPISGQANVNISGFAFVPQTLNDSSSHTITSNDNLFESGTISKGASFKHTFNQKGTFNYHCSIHPAMTGKIIVE